MNDKRTWLGGEAIAKEYLQKCGLKILQTNYKTNFGEIDIIARDGDYFVFVEVKARATLKFGRPAEAVTKTKQHKLRQLATAYLTSKKLFPSLMRFDVVEVLDFDTINHIRDAF